MRAPLGPKQAQRLLTTPTLPVNYLTQRTLTPAQCVTVWERWPTATTAQLLLEGQATAALDGTAARVGARPLAHLLGEALHRYVETWEGETDVAYLERVEHPVARIEVKKQGVRVTVEHGCLEPEGPLGSRPPRPVGAVWEAWVTSHAARWSEWDWVQIAQRPLSLPFIETHLHQLPLNNLCLYNELPGPVLERALARYPQLPPRVWGQACLTTAFLEQHGVPSDHWGRDALTRLWLKRQHEDWPLRWPTGFLWPLLGGQATLTDALLNTLTGEVWEPGWAHNEQLVANPSWTTALWERYGHRWDAYTRARYGALTTAYVHTHLDELPWDSLTRNPTRDRWLTPTLRVLLALAGHPVAQHA